MTAPARVTISRWSAVSPFGLSTADFAAGIRDASPPAGDPRRVTGFDVREVLGRKGTRALDRQAALAVAAAGQLLIDGDGGPPPAVVLGTRTSSVQSMMDFARDILTQAKPYYVDPAQFPNTVLNTAASRCAMWYQLTGPNVTVSGGRVSGLLALNYARRLQAAGRAKAVVCGAVEELSPDREWLEAGAGVLGEGCALLLVEPVHPGGRTGLAEVLGLEFAIAPDPGGVAAALAGCARRLFTKAGESPDRVWAVASSCGADPIGDGEAAAITEVLGERDLVRLRSTHLVGDTNGAAAAFALVSAVAAAGGTADPGGRTALVTAADADGVVGCALLRFGSHNHELPG